MSREDLPRFVLRGPSMTQPRVLVGGFPRERREEYAERLIQAVDASGAELAGSGQRVHVPIELDCRVESPDGVRASRLTLARELGALLADLARTTEVEYAGTRLPVYRVRCVSRVPTRRGYRLTLRLYSSQHEFTDADGVAVPIA